MRSQSRYIRSSGRPILFWSYARSVIKTILLFGALITLFVGGYTASGHFFGQHAYIPDRESGTNRSFGIFSHHTSETIHNLIIQTDTNFGPLEGRVQFHWVSSTYRLKHTSQIQGTPRDLENYFYHHGPGGGGYPLRQTNTLRSFSAAGIVVSVKRITLNTTLDLWETVTAVRIISISSLSLLLFGGMPLGWWTVRFISSWYYSRHVSTQGFDVRPSRCGMKQC